MDRYITLVFKVNREFIFLFIIITIFIQCSSFKEQSDQIADDSKYKMELSSTLWEKRNLDSLELLLNQFISQKDEIGKMLTYKVMGVRQRHNARFSDAINSHHEGLDIALILNDTLEIVQAMNNLGTNFRRIGAHSEASQYHFQALHYIESWSKLDTPDGMKNRAMALNGIGNISLMLGFYDDAEEKFCKALKDEIELVDPIGQAINYANIGAIFEIRQQYDSAYVYYNKSLEQNKIAKSDMGMGLCFIHLGELYEKEKKYDLAKVEYLKAYDLMNHISDKWHWLQASIALARINLATENISKFKNYVELAENTAKEIESPEHLAAVYLLKHDYHIKQGNYKLALQHYKQHEAFQDSVQGIKKINRHLDIRLAHERNKNSLKLQQIEVKRQVAQKRGEYLTYMSLLIIVVSLIIFASLYYAYRQRTRSNKILKKLETVRSDFFTNITHELRTPLTVIQGLNRQMQEKKDITEKERIAFRAAIERQSNNLLNLVNQLLDLAKLKKGADDPQWKRGNIIAYLEMTAEAFRLYALEKGVNLMFYSDIEASEMDFIPSYIDKIASNLLSNAIKHTDAGGKIDFVIAEGQRPDTIIIRISDTGEGIPQKDIDNIFDLFYQSPQARNISGTGIGLAFTQMMVEKMKGEIVVESQLGKGTVFTIILPLKNKQLPYIYPLKEDDKTIVTHSQKPIQGMEDKNNTKTSKIESNSTKPIILIVEDNSDILLYLKSLLIEKYEVVTAWNGEEGLRAAEKHIPDLVITDLMMPIKDGYQFVTEMKQNRLLDHIPVIMLTAKTTDEDRIKGLRCGVEAYIRKPFQHDELLVRVENIFDNRRLLRERYMSAITRSSSESKLNNDANMKFLQTITNIIYAELTNPDLNSVFLADKMAMSVSQLSRKINSITGYSTISYVLQLKLSKAKKMLANESVSVNEVSDACGFYDASYFSRVFKKEFGLSPSYFQKMPNMS